MARALPERARLEPPEIGARRVARGEDPGGGERPGPGRRVLRPSPLGLPPAEAGFRCVRDQLYWFGAAGFLFTSPWVASESTERQAAVLLLSASGEPFEVTLAGRRFLQRAIAFAPLTRRGLRAPDVGLVSLNVQAHHPCFPIFSQIPRTTGQPMSREVFARFDHALLRAYQGELSHLEARRLFEGLIDVAVAQIEIRQIRRPRDRRLAQLHALLRANPDCSLGEIAGTLGVAYTSASHLFARAVGLRLRAYQHWLRCMRAVDGLRGEASLTEIALSAGFADSSHFSRTWQQRVGVSPSYIRDAERVRIIDPPHSGDALPKAGQEPRRPGRNP